MPTEEENLALAAQAERDLNSNAAKTGTGRMGTSATESGVNNAVEERFPGAKVTYGSEASGAGDNRTIPDEEGGGINKETGKQTKAGDFEGVGGPEEKQALRDQERPGDQDVQSNVRQGGGKDTRYPS